MNESTTALVPAEIVMRDVAKSFESTPVLRTVNLSIDRGEIVAIVGRSGIGKSTILRLICGLFAPDDGDITIANATTEEARKRHKFGFVPQLPALMPWRTVAQNVMLPIEIQKDGSQICREHHIAVMTALTSVGLEGLTERLPRELSGGQQHRVALARAIVNLPTILLLDEPFHSVDELTREELYANVATLWTKRHHTIVFVTHNIEEAARLANRVIVLDVPRSRTKIPNRGATIVGEVCIPPLGQTSPIREIDEIVEYAHDVRCMLVRESSQEMI